MIDALCLTPLSVSSQVDSWLEVSFDAEARRVQANVPPEHSCVVTGLTETRFPCWNVAGHFCSSGFIIVGISKRFTTYRYVSLSWSANKSSGNFLMLLFPSHLNNTIHNFFLSLSLPSHIVFCHWMQALEIYLLYTFNKENSKIIIYYKRWT